MASSCLLPIPNITQGAYYLNHEIQYTIEENTMITTAREMFLDFFINFQTLMDNDKKMKTFHCEFDEAFQGETDDYRYFYTLIKSGNYGSTSDVVDNDTIETVFTISPNQTPEKPFFLFIAIPKDNKEVKVQKGLLIFQNVGAYGIKTITTEYLNDFFATRYNTSLICKSISPRLFIEKMITQERVNKIIMTRNDKSADKADNIFNGFGKETRILANLSLDIASWRGLYNKIKFFSNRRSNLFEFQGISYDELRLNVKIGENLRTINLNNLENLSIIEKIPDEIRMADGLPNRELLIEHFVNVTSDYLEEMVLATS